MPAKILAAATVTYFNKSPALHAADGNGKQIQRNALFLFGKNYYVTALILLGLTDFNFYRGRMHPTPAKVSARFSFRPLPTLPSALGGRSFRPRYSTAADLLVRAFPTDSRRSQE